jgi:autotransporter-associated beta strand protein
LYIVAGLICVLSPFKPFAAHGVPYTFKGAPEINWVNPSAWNSEDAGFPDAGVDVNFLSAGTSLVSLPRGPIRIGTLVVAGGVQQTIAGGTLEVAGGLRLGSMGSQAREAALEFLRARVVVKAPIIGGSTNLIRVNGGRVIFEGSSNQSDYSGTFELKGGAVGVVGDGTYPLGDSNFATVIVDDGTLSADGLPRSIDNPVRFKGTVESGAAITLGELGAGVLTFSSMVPVKLGSGGTYRIVVAGTSVISSGIQGAPTNALAPISSVIKQGPGTLVMGMEFSEVNTVSVEQGTLDLSAGNKLLSGVRLVMSGGTLILRDSSPLGESSQEVSGLAIRGGLIQARENETPTIVLTDGNPSSTSNSTKVIDANVESTAIVNASILEDAPMASTKLSKTGPGVLVLNRANDFSRGVDLHSGVLEVGALDALGSGTLSWSGGTLRAGNSSQEIGNPISLQSESRLRLGGASSGTLTFSGNVNLGSRGVLDVVSDTVFAGDVSGGSLEVTGYGRLILSGTTTFRGHTLVGNGNLKAGKGGLSQTSRIEVVGGGLDIVDYQSSAPMRVSGGGSVHFSGVDEGSGTITLDGGMLRGDEVDLQNRRIEIIGKGGNVIKGGNLTQGDSPRFRVGGTTIQPSGMLMVDGSVGMKSLAVKSGGGLIIPDGVTLTTGGLSAEPGSRLTWDLSSNVDAAVRVTGNSPVDVSGLIVEVPAESLAALMKQVLPAEGQVLVAAGKSAVVRTLIAGSGGSITKPQSFDMGSATLRFRLDNRAGSVVIMVDRNTLSKVIKSSRSSAFLAALDAISDAADPAAVAAPVAAAGAAFMQPVAAALLQPPVAAAGSRPTSLVNFLRMVQQLQSADQIRALLSPLDGGRGYADLSATYGLQGLALSGPLDAHLDALASYGFTDSSVSMGVNVQPSVSPISDDTKFLSGAPSSDPRSTAWIAGYGLSSRLDPDSARDYSGVNASGGGSVLGLERRFGDLRVGGIVVAGQASYRVADPDIRLESEHWNVGGYGSVRFGRVTVDSSAMFGVSSMESERPLLGDTARADFKSKDLQLALGVTVNLAGQDSRWEISPVFRLKYLRSDQGRFQEQGSIAPLTGEPVVIDRLFSRVGLRLGRHGQISENFGLGFFGAAYWLHDFTPSGNEMAFRLAGVPYRARARDVDSDMIQLNMGVQASIYKAWILNLGGQRDMGAQRSQQTGMVSVGFRF